MKRSETLKFSIGAIKQDEGLDFEMQNYKIRMLSISHSYTNASKPRLTAIVSV